MLVDYTYNIYFDIGALIFLVFIAFRYFLFKKFKNKTSILFGNIIICSFFLILLDIFGSVLIDNINDYPILLTKIVNYFYYSSHAILPIFVLAFTIYFTGFDEVGNKFHLAYILPFIAILITLTNPFHHLIFNVINDGTTNMFIKGTLSIVPYINTAYCFLAGLIFVLSNKRKLKSTHKIVMVIIVLTIFVFAIIQYFNPNLLLTGTGLVVSIMLMMYTIQNPDDMIETVSGAFNYNAAIIYLESAIKAKKKQNVIVVEIHGVGAVNKNAGLNTGNYLLETIYKFFRSLFTKGYIFKISNSTFMLAIDEKEDVKSISDQIKNRFISSWTYKDSKFTLSIKVSYFPLTNNFKKGLDVLNLIDLVSEYRSDDASNMVYEVDKTFKDKIQKRIDIEEEIRYAINNDIGFRLNFQPIYNLKDKAFTNAETLLRFESKRLGKISPADFIPIAESIGLMGKIDRFVIRNSCKFLKNNPNIKKLQINLSATNFMSNPAKEIALIVSQNGINPNRICFEFTETAAAKHPENINLFISQLGSLGFSFALDDFGTGYSNFNSALKLPVDIIKLDKTLLQTDNKSSKFLSAIIDTLKSLNYLVLIEGVETAEQASYVSKLGVDYIQGYYYSYPIEFDDALEFFKRQENVKE